ncbi:MAG: adenylate/guanylate cyclase domain-containing protein [Spirochaetia bacterium]|nr:adenylate/guanylate cyclase domain-containing protein [Spirochaetia bacterium]
MNYNIEFQIASIIFITVLTIVFYSKKRWGSLANLIFRAIMIVTLIELALDIASVITITQFQNGNKQIERLNNFLSKSYLIAIAAYIFLIDSYAIVNTIKKGIEVGRLTFKYIQCFIFAFFFIIVCVVIICNPLLYGGSGKFIYSYGIPSDMIYVFSTVSVVFCVITFFANLKKVSKKRLVPIVTFCVMEGSVAIIQAFNKELLIVGLGSAVSCLIMYFALENPDMNIIEELNRANKRAKDLILNVLPLSIAKRLEFNLKPFFDEYENVTIMFLDIIDFTKMTNEVGGTSLVRILNDFFGELDDLLENFRIEKIKTIGDAYMVASGVPDRYENTCDETVKFARQVIRRLEDFNKRNNLNINVRIGINNGRVVAGVIGKTKFIYDLWGEPVNLAWRLQTNGIANRIHVSGRVKSILDGKYDFEERGSLDMKGFGSVKTFLLK